MTVATPGRDEWEVKSDVFARSYDEVLTALKHQDEKLNRTLTAIAFLTAAGVALFTFVAPRDIAFPGSAIDVSAFLFVVFLVAVAFALALALAAIGPSTHYRHLWEWDKRGGTVRSTREPSLIFYAGIAGDPDWARYIEQPAAKVRERLARNFHDEAQVIAYRVNYKIERSRESGAFVQLTILSLALLGIFSAEAFSIHTRWWIAMVLLVGMLLLPLLDLMNMHWTKFSQEPYSWFSYLIVAATTVLAATVLAIAPYNEGHWLALTYALALVTLDRLAFAERRLARRIFPLSLLGGIAVLVLVLAA